MLERLLTDDSLQALVFLCLPLTVLLIILIVAFVRGWHVPASLSLPVSSTVARLGDLFSRAIPSPSITSVREEMPHKVPVAVYGNYFLFSL